jgi:hypothetical protein
MDILTSIPSTISHLSLKFLHAEAALSRCRRDRLHQRWAIRRRIRIRTGSSLLLLLLLLLPLLSNAAALGTACAA